ncbi:hypothetical protein SAMN05518847_103228 [Paenibacillus sp. OV219]|nr:hypothetical protein SAMN05518847_103228 [Paenibacillus sp. OV219]
MKVVVVSDTHMTRMAKKLPERLIEELKSANAILHAGDWMALSVLEMLEQYAQTEGVAGNNDGSEIVARLGWRKLLEIEGVRIGIVHGHKGTGVRSDTELNAYRAFEKGQVDVVVFGHSHIPVKRERDGVLMFNPGSPTDKRRQAQYSFGILTIESGKVKSAEHIFYDNKN